LEVKKIASLREMRKKDSIIYGAKSANLGELLNGKVANISVPDAFTVPFYWYDKFIKDNGIDKLIDEHLWDDNFIHNPRFRKQKLEELRAKIQNGKFDESLKAEIIQRWKTQLGGKPVFVRSSSNAEDLPNFSGAGLYSSVPNVKEEEKLIEGVKKVWSSLWNFHAYEARVRNYVDHTTVYMSALIQVGIDMDRGGVMISKDPFDAKSKGSIFISAVCGHASNVVNNQGIPEQVLLNPRSNSVVIMTLSDQKNSLRFDPNGDLKEVPDKCANPTNKRVLSDAQVRSLANVATNIKKVFGNKAEQDIEWGILNGKIYIVQSRPYIEKQ
jgi:phosphoenolpyruvate synthase/pyruvate phosphate dikinase